MSIASMNPVANSPERTPGIDTMTAQPPLRAAPVDTPKAVEPAVAAMPGREELDEAVSHINKTLQSLSQDLVFSVDEDSKRTIVKVIDQQTQVVIRQMPSPEALEIAKALDKVSGLLIRHSA